MDDIYSRMQAMQQAGKLKRQDELTRKQGQIRTLIDMQMDSIINAAVMCGARQGLSPLESVEAAQAAIFERLCTMFIHHHHEAYNGRCPHPDLGINKMLSELVYCYDEAHDNMHREGELPDA